MTVDTPEELTLEIELETDDGETSLELELEWTGSSEASPSPSLEVSPEGDDEAVAPEEVTPPSPLARFEVYQNRDDGWRWRSRHRNWNVISTSGQGDTRNHNALKGLRSVTTNSAAATTTGEFTD